MGKFWGVFFTLMTVSFIIKATLTKKSVGLAKISWITKIVIGCLPLFLLIMWLDSTISINTRIINTFIGAASISASIGYLYFSRRKSGELK